MAIQSIKVDEVQRLRDSGQSPFLLDVRTPAEFHRIHAVGARLVPLDTLDPNTIAASRPSADAPIYVICQSGVRSGKACQRLEQANIGPIYSLEGGTDAWVKMGFPVERGQSGMISLERQVRIAAGSLTLLGLGLAWLIHPAFLGLSAFVGAGLVFAGITDTCGMGMVLARMPWNR